MKKSRGTLGAQLALTTSSGATIGADFLDGSKRPNVDALCSKLVAALKERHTKAGGGVDDQTADQLALCMAFASGPSRLRLPKPSCRHLETVMHFAARFTGAAYDLIGEGESVVLACTPKPSIINLGGVRVAGCSIREEGLRAARPARSRRSRPPYDTRRRAPGARACRAHLSKCFRLSPSDERRRVRKANQSNTSVPHSRLLEVRAARVANDGAGTDQARQFLFPHRHWNRPVLSLRDGPRRHRRDVNRSPGLTVVVSGAIAASHEPVGAKCITSLSAAPTASSARGRSTIMMAPKNDFKRDA